MSTPGPGGGGTRGLAELLGVWQAWNSGDVTDRAARRAEAAGEVEQAENLRALGRSGPSAIDALAAQHELTSLLDGWRWHTVLAAREQGATWNDIAAATATAGLGDPEEARAEFLAHLERARDAEARFAIPFRDAERYAAAAAPDPESGRAVGSASHEQETTDMTTEPRPAHGDDQPLPHGPHRDDPGLALEDAWFRSALEDTVPADTPDRAAVIDASLEVARDRFLADGTATEPEQALALVRERDEQGHDDSGARAPVQALTGAELLVRAEQADNRTYLASSLQELDDAYRELEAVEGEASRRGESMGAGADRALADYLGFLIDDPGVERFEEYTALHNAAHEALGVAATPPEDTDAVAGAERVPMLAREQSESPDAARWSPAQIADDHRAEQDGLVIGSIVLSGGLPPDDDEEEDAVGERGGNDRAGQGHSGHVVGSWDAPLERWENQAAAEEAWATTEYLDRALDRDEFSGPERLVRAERDQAAAEGVWRSDTATLLGELEKARAIGDVARVGELEAGRGELDRAYAERLDAVDAAAAEAERAEQRLEQLSGAYGLQECLELARRQEAGYLDPDEEYIGPHTADDLDAQLTAKVRADPAAFIGTELADRLPAANDADADAGVQAGEAGDSGGAEDVDAQIAAAYDRGPWTETSTGRQWDSLGARGVAADSRAREAGGDPSDPPRVDDAAEIERRLTEIRARVAARDAALAAPTDGDPAYRAADEHHVDGSSLDAGVVDDDAQGWDR